MPAKQSLERKGLVLCVFKMALFKSATAASQGPDSRVKSQKVWSSPKYMCLHTDYNQTGIIRKEDWLSSHSENIWAGNLNNVC